MNPTADHLPNLLASRVSPAEEPLLRAFLAWLLPLMTGRPDTPPPCWCDADGLLTVFHFLRNAPDSIRVQITPVISPAPASVTEGMRLLVHLPDTPFMLDAVRSYLKQSRLALYTMTHGVLSARRTATGALEAVVAPADGTAEMLLMAIIEPVLEKGRLAELVEGLHAVLLAVRHSVEAFPAMRKRLDEAAAWLLTVERTEEGRFIRWLLEDNFVLMGLREMQEQRGMPVLDGLRLGIFDTPEADALVDRVMPGLMHEVMDILTASAGEILVIDYCRHGRSIIYAAEGVDFFAVRQRDAAGGVRILLVFGRFSRTALANRASTVPILAARSGEILALSGLLRGSSAYHEFRSLYDRMPLRELFYSEPAVVARQILDILRLQGDTDVRVMARMGRHGHYAALLCAFSRHRHRPGLEEEIASEVSRYLGEPVTATTVAGTNTRVFVVCYLAHNPLVPFEPDVAALEQAIANLIRTWMDRLREALLKDLSPPEVQRLLSHHAPRLVPLYQNAIQPDEAVQDLAMLERLRLGEGFALRIGPGYVTLYGRHPFYLARMIRTFNHLGLVCLHEFSCELRLPERDTVWLVRYEVDVSDQALLASRGPLLEQVLAMVMARRLDDDTLNRLALLAGLTPRQLTILVGLRQYLVQLHPHLSGMAINRALLAHPDLAHLLVEGFAVRLAPDSDGDTASWQQRFDQALSGVTNLGDDQVLRALHDLILATLRTNAFVQDLPATLAIKIDPQAMVGLAAPRPWREIFVYGPGLEGIHLRGGPVSRGGIRHSDRLDDYRAEVLGLMQTQRVKNAIIVPEGAKGGFVLTHGESLTADQRKEETVRQYRRYIRALLSVTDNRQGTEVIPPAGVKTLDGPDPYLVVAADKGTAAFSDLANEEAVKAGFWLADAFASGGSRGYNHKEMGITARGAWACIQLHLQEMGRDPADEITVIGIGDMSGDVFGNGLLASRKLLLVGAFDHRHIFLDPNPEPEASWQERRRLFSLPRSSWADYRREIISEGGGVFARQDKAIPLSLAVRRLLGVDRPFLSGEALIQHLLCAPVDLLYNGGIGTYIKSSQETHEEVHDKANDPVRVDAHQVKARILAEGGNLGITRRGRLAYARPRGGWPAGRINSDAVDNSGGVDLSDHEVNLKILLTTGIQPAERDNLLASVATEVATAVLADNHDQHLAISHDQWRSRQHPETYLELIDYLVEQAGLDPWVEAIPDREQLASWSQGDEGLPRPLLAILLGYAKIHCREALLASDLVDAPCNRRFLTAYFPATLAARIPPANHFLRREIIASQMTNQVLNRTGVGLFFGVLLRNRREGESVQEVIPSLLRGYLMAETLLAGEGLRQQANQSRANPEGRQLALNRLAEVLIHVAMGLTRTSGLALAEETLHPWTMAIARLTETMQDTLPSLLSQQRLSDLVLEHRSLLDQGLPETLARRLCWLPLQNEMPILLSIAMVTHLPLERLMAIHIRLADHFGLDWLEERLPRVRNRDLWGRLTVAETRRLLAHCREHLVRTVAGHSPAEASPLEACEGFLNSLGEDNTTYQTLLLQAKRQEQADLLPLTVLVGRLRQFVT